MRGKDAVRRALEHLGGLLHNDCNDLMYLNLHRGFLLPLCSLLQFPFDYTTLDIEICSDKPENVQFYPIKLGVCMPAHC